jgi:hypothetical protein
MYWDICMLFTSYSWIFSCLWTWWLKNIFSSVRGKACTVNKNVDAAGWKQYGWAFLVHGRGNQKIREIFTFSVTMNTVKKSMPEYAKFRCWQRWRRTKGRGRRNFPSPTLFGSHHRCCPHRNFAQIFYSEQKNTKYNQYFLQPRSTFIVCLLLLTSWKPWIFLSVPELMQSYSYEYYFKLKLCRRQIFLVFSSTDLFWRDRPYYKPLLVFNIFIGSPIFFLLVITGYTNANSHMYCC